MLDFLFFFKIEASPHGVCTLKQVRGSLEHATFHIINVTHLDRKPL